MRPPRTLRQRKIDWGHRLCALLLFCATTAIALPAQTFTTVQSFDGTDGASPYAGLVQVTNGSLYGTTQYGGADGQGSVFKMTPSGTLATLYSFCTQSTCTDGEAPYAGLVQNTDGNVYGTTQYGGANGKGTVFKIGTSGTLTTIYSFCSQSGCGDGELPFAALVRSSGGDLYGTTYYGGAYGSGTIFRINTSGTLTTLYSFCSQSDCTDGGNPAAALVQASNGGLYGTTSNGGANFYYGTIFEISPTGTLTTLHSFDGMDGGYPSAALVQASNGNFYGTTSSGGSSLNYGTVFEITSSGTLTTLYSFCSLSGCVDGENPDAPLVQATDGNFYGTTAYGGAEGAGTVFEITASGTLTTLHSFEGTDGEGPYGALTQDTNGTFYGTTRAGGSGACYDGCGTVFSVSVGLGPFVETQPTSGKVGAAVKILGTNLKGAKSVSFNGTAATFTVLSSSEISTAVPAGATTGKVQVTTSAGPLTSNVNFLVTP
jgi:uncharacterized repeat protein (TIGR03803 family)